MCDDPCTQPSRQEAGLREIVPDVGDEPVGRARRWHCNGFVFCFIAEDDQLRPKGFLPRNGHIVREYGKDGWAWKIVSHQSVYDMGIVHLSTGNR